MIWALLWMIFMITLFIGTYIMNRNTPRPEGCENIEGCEGCHNMACGHHVVHQKEEKS